jgi:hypothetical protein
MAWTNVVFNWKGSARYQLTLPTLADGQLGELQCTQRGLLRVAVESTVEPEASLSVRALPGAGLAASSGTIASAAAELLEVHGHSETNTACYLMFFDAAANPANGAVPKQKMRIPADCPMFSLTLTLKPVAYATGIRWAVSTTPDTLTTTGAIKLYVEGVYR